ncbi:MAG: HAD-IA family hydrolase [Chloroflexi bacterium]|nr:HAD-IA family hydrolase [Chloroflexota bacterium]
MGDLRRLRAILFDLDDTLADTESLTPVRLEAVREALVRDVAPDLLERGVAQARSWDPVATPGRLERLREALALPEGLAARMREVYNRVLYERLRPFPGVEEMLLALRRKLFVGLVTNGPSELQRKKLEVLGFGPCFDVIVISGEVGFGKPDPRIFRLALAAGSVEPAEALYVGDRPDQDVGGAKAAGLAAAQVRQEMPFAVPPGPEPDYVVERATEIPALLEERGLL